MTFITQGGTTEKLYYYPFGGLAQHQVETTVISSLGSAGSAYSLASRSQARSSVSSPLAKQKRSTRSAGGRA